MNMIFFESTILKLDCFVNGLLPLGFNFRFGVLEDVSDVEVSISCSNAQNKYLNLYFFNLSIKFLSGDRFVTVDTEISRVSLLKIHRLVDFL